MRIDSAERKAILAAACLKFPKASHSTLARKLTESHPALFPNHNTAVTAIRWHRGARGKISAKNAAQHGTAQPLRPSGKLPALPASLAKPRVPYELQAKRVLCLSDIHIPFHDNAALEAAFAHGEKFKPDCILLNGDILDFQAISRFIRDPRGPTVREELDTLKELLAHIRMRFKRSRIVYRMGNHDERWETFLFTRAPELLDVAEFTWEQVAGIAESRVEMVRGRREVMAGRLAIWHGHEKGKQLSAPVNQARGMFLRYLACALEGHGHRTSSHNETTVEGRLISCWSTGCLCGLWPDYAVVNKWDQGFATIEVAEDGSYGVDLKRIINGSIY